MKTDQIICCVVALLLGMLLANMLKSVCGCKVMEGQPGAREFDFTALRAQLESQAADAAAAPVYERKEDDPGWRSGESHSSR